MIASWAREIATRIIFCSEESKSFTAQPDTDHMFEQVTKETHDALRDACRDEVRSALDRHLPKFLDDIAAVVNGNIEKSQCRADMVTVSPA